LHVLSTIVSFVKENLVSFEDLTCK
jgi:hypothetical protein